MERSGFEDNAVPPLYSSMYTQYTEVKQFRSWTAMDVTLHWHIIGEAPGQEYQALQVQHYALLYVFVLLYTSTL